MNNMHDGFSENGDDSGVRRAIVGTKLVFDNTAQWLGRDDEPIAPDLVLCVLDIERVYQKWLNQAPVETIFLKPREACPDIDNLNEQCPKSEWSKDFNGNPRGPWQFQISSTAAGRHFLPDIDRMSHARKLSSFPSPLRGVRAGRCYPRLVSAHGQVSRGLGPTRFSAKPSIQVGA